MHTVWRLAVWQSENFTKAFFTSRLAEVSKLVYYRVLKLLHFIGHYFHSLKFFLVRNPFLKKGTFVLLL